jgi:maltose alpha-D-glucosyltransferase/alpha-amylase
MSQKDLAGMFRSFHYAIYSTIFNHGDDWKDKRRAVSLNPVQVPNFHFMDTYLQSMFNNT